MPLKRSGLAIRLQLKLQFKVRFIVVPAHEFEHVRVNHPSQTNQTSPSSNLLRNQITTPFQWAACNWIWFCHQFPLLISLPQLKVGVKLIW